MLDILHCYCGELSLKFNPLWAHCLANHLPVQLHSCHYIVDFSVEENELNATWNSGDRKFAGFINGNRWNIVSMPVDWTGFICIILLGLNRFYTGIRPILLKSSSLSNMVWCSLIYCTLPVQAVICFRVSRMRWCSVKCAECFWSVDIMSCWFIFSLFLFVVYAVFSACGRSKLLINDISVRSWVFISPPDKFAIVAGWFVINRLQLRTCLIEWVTDRRQNTNNSWTTSTWMWLFFADDLNTLLQNIIQSVLCYK